MNILRAHEWVEVYSMIRALKEHNDKLVSITWGASCLLLFSNTMQ